MSYDLIKHVKDKNLFIYEFKKAGNISSQEVLTVAENFIQRIYDKDNLFYIGVTQSPSDRIMNHINTKYGSVIMHMIGVCFEKESASNIEKDLISAYGSNKNNYNTYIKNKYQFGGGEGLRDGDNFIYILEIDKELATEDALSVLFLFFRMIN